MVALPPIFILFAAVSLALALLLPSLEAAQPPYACDSSNPSTRKYAFCRTERPVKQRARDLVSRLTLDEKVSQLVNHAPAIPRLGIPAFEWWSEALHGVANAGFGVSFNGTIPGATSFPQVITTAASFDVHLWYRIGQWWSEALHGVANAGFGVSFSGTIPSATSFPQVITTAASFDVHLWYRIGQAIGKEARAVYNEGQAKGMTFWAPNINIFRDPRWGRGQETPGEDPLVTGRYAVAYVRGVQGDTFEGGALKDGHLQASACCKHFTAYDLDHWNNVTRYAFDARVTPQDLADTYQPPFQSCIEEAQASGIMCAYNRVNGVPNCADYNLLTKTAREKWAFDGYITSDCDAVSIIHDVQGYAKVPEDAVAGVLKAGMDVNCGSYLKNYTKSAVQKRKVGEADIDRALHNLFAVRMRLGLFNGNPSKLLYGNIGADQVCTPQHKSLALEAAKAGIVLLKNQANLLPLPKCKSLSLAVIGPNADAAKTLLGNYHGIPCKSISPLGALQAYANNIRYSPGCNSVACPSASIQDAVKVAKEADYVVMIMGLDQTQEREEFDRVYLGLPGQQQSLITQVSRAAKKPVVLVLLSGGSVDVAFARDDPHIGAILWAGYPGEAGGLALSQTLFGDNNPGGRLPLTWYPKEYVKVPMTDMRMRPDPASGYPGRTYRFYSGPTVFEFGHGYSYSTYSYEFVSISHKHIALNSKTESKRVATVAEIGEETCRKVTMTARIGVKNEGRMGGRHPVLLFVKQHEKQSWKPLKKLVGFQSVSLDAGEREELEFELSPCHHLSSANENGLMVVEEGTHFLVVGDQEFPITVAP